MKTVSHGEVFFGPVQLTMTTRTVDVAQRIFITVIVMHPKDKYTLYKEREKESEK